MNLKSKLKTKWFWSVLLVASCISGLTIAVSYLSLFQLLEWLTYDSWFRLRPLETKETRIVVVTISESDINELGQWPMSDRTLSQLITKINQQQPRAIGLDIYRDLPVKPGTAELESVLRSTPNLIGVEKVVGKGVKPSPILKQQDQLALADFVRDADGKIRRGLLAIELDNGQVQFGLATKVALMYLAAEGIEPKSVGNTGKISLGKAELLPFTTNDGGYIRADNGGFQILMNYRGTETSFPQISIVDVLNGQIPKDLMNNRIVLIGSIAPSLNDFFATPYSSSPENQFQDLPGVFIHANLASQILSGALDGRSSIQTVSEPWEWIWIFVWTFGISISNLVLLDRQLHSRSALFIIFISTLFFIIVPGLALIGFGYLLFLGGFWLPVISPLFSLTLSAITISWYYNQTQEQLALIDSLTQIPNRRCFDEFLDKQWKQNNIKRQSLSIILCDVDFFKQYNDTYGHQAGDLCLQKVAQTLTQSIRNSDLTARYGGEEFVIVLPNTPSDAALNTAQRLCDRIKSLQIPHCKSQASEYVTISCGVASANFNLVKTPEELVANADKALYKAKEQGRDRAVFWNEDNKVNNFNNETE
ncbi:MAG: CHASE2 domain-containing protein [Xenococcaceae cyanobacterium MO_188.B32]|nr:CHASE2 domain-containing protein [Xenococcaceae cyanobacterium MO_188.B32]